MPPPASTMLPPVPVDTRTADQLAEIAFMEGTTVSRVVRRALEGYVQIYLQHVRAAQQDYDSGPSSS